jgi:cytoskeletal protein CcmA (bactofilin family)
MQNLKIEGISTIRGGEYGIVSIEGVGKCVGDLKAESLTIEGVFEAEGKIEVDKFRCDGAAKIRGDLRAKLIEVDGALSGSTNIEAASVFCDGMIKIFGQISADTIEADGAIRAREIVGDSIRIKSLRHIFWFFTYRGSCKSRIELIEATTVNLVGVSAEAVNGKDVTIGRGCDIDRVDCSGTLFISPNARVGTVTGNYARREE